MNDLVVWHHINWSYSDCVQLEKLTIGDFNNLFLQEINTKKKLVKWTYSKLIDMKFETTANNENEEEIKNIVVEFSFRILILISIFGNGKINFRTKVWNIWL